MIYRLLGFYGSEYKDITVVELPNYATLDKLVEDSEWQALFSEMKLATKDSYMMLTRSIPAP